GARIDLDFSDFTGCILNRGLLPTGSPMDRFKVPGIGMLDVSVVDVANLCAFVRGSDVGMDNTEDIESLQANQEIVAKLEAIRAVVALETGLVSRDVDIDRELRRRVNPLMFIVGTPRDYDALNGEHIDAGNTDIFARSLARWAFSKTYPATGSIGTGVACTVAGSIPAEVVRGGPPARGETRSVRIGHPSGTLVTEAGISADGQLVIRGSVGRTARVLMEGTAFVRV
ncbi:MAG TPA: PrpF domain-containing protein, partial [Chloroflexota bacterium]|nr:PrpF domain-containing protein [Chloroflexota bacterium]